MALTGTSTFDDAMAQLNANLAWEGSPSKAADALEAVRWLLFNRAKVSMRQTSQMQFESLADLEKRLSSYVGSVSPTATAQRSPFVRAVPR